MIGDDVARWNAAHILFAVSMALAFPPCWGLYACWGAEAHDSV